MAGLQFAQMQEAGVSDPIVTVTITRNDDPCAGVVVSADDATSPQNYVVAWHDGAKAYLAKIWGAFHFQMCVSQTSAFVDGELLEIRKSGSEYELWYRGAQLGTTQTIEGLESNPYAGVCYMGAASFGAVNIHQYGTPRGFPISTTYSSATYPSGKSILSLRFDDGYTEDWTVAYPELQARGLVAGFALVRDKISATDKLSLAQILTMQASGHEIMCHSRTHSSDPVDDDEFTDESRTAGEEMRLIGLDTANWVQPGTWVGAYHMNSVAWYGTYADLLLRANFAAYEAYIVAGSGSRPLPVTGDDRYGAQHQTGDNETLVYLETWLNSVIAGGLGGEMLFHSYLIGDPGCISLADFQAFLDYVKAAVDAGDLVVLTPTQQAYATPV